MSLELGASKILPLYITKEHQFFFSSSSFITQGPNKKLFGHSEATCIVQLPLDCWEHLEADNGVPDRGSAQRTYSGVSGLGLVPVCSGEDWGPFLGQALISILQFVGRCLPASEGFPILVQCRLPNRLALRASSVPVLVPPLWMHSEAWVIVHSQWAIHHCVDWIPMTLAPRDNVSFFTKLMVNIWSASSI